MKRGCGHGRPIYTGNSPNPGRPGKGHGRNAAPSEQPVPGKSNAVAENSPPEKKLKIQEK